jgi:hypothetical protein
MKRHLLVLLLLVVSAITVEAQTSSPAPDAYGYTWKNDGDPAGPVYNWIDITSWPGTVTVTGLADDNIVGPFPMTVPFHYYWYNPTKIYIGSNGYIEFDKNNTVASPFPVIPNGAGIQDYLAVMTSDLTFTDANGEPVPGAKCMYWQNADTLIVTWDSVPFWNSAAPGYSGLNTFQVILNNPDSSITFQYQTQSGLSFSATSFMTIGIESKAGSIGLPYQQGGLINDFYPVAPSAVRFYFPEEDTASVNDVATNWVNNPLTGGIFLSKNGAPFVSVAEGVNSGSTPQGTFDFYSRVVNRLNQIQVRDTVLFPATVAGQSQIFNFPDTWVPNDTGTFRQIVETRLGATDIVATNNIKTLEIRVVDTTLTPILLSFDNGVDDGTGGLSWAGGGGGGAVYFIPPFTPCNINALRAMVVANPNAVSCDLYIVDDDGPNGAPNTIIDSINVPASVINIGLWTQVPLPSPVTIDSGGFYLAWMMGGDGIALGQNAIGTLVPVSNRTYEVLGPVNLASSWSDWRSRESYDMLLNAFIDGVVGVDESSKLNESFGSVYPNPSSDKIYLNYDLTSSAVVSMIVEVYTIDGKQVSSNPVSERRGTLEINVKDLSSGSYFCKIRLGNTSVQRQFTVVD